MSTETPQEQNPFVRFRPQILIGARATYLAELWGVEPDPEVVSVLPLIIGPVDERGRLDDEAIRQARIAEAEVRVAARQVARLAGLRDQIEKGGLLGIVARFETGATKLFERKYVADAVESGLVDQVRDRQAMNVRITPI